ncbi:hypothetical protein M501DRAFT_1054835 [Patellaria atrata CBS 101060]|uniref:Uncharacterized protein n=1 Tax=Patellaria atrata CBS 101060 TaxID=1346257 RepID=A0A9P4SGJ3_9PEZI|nr:hypothetical protein M501DRAFT_1054835 [Patellaria atrata CBS 101060]
MAAVQAGISPNPVPVAHVEDRLALHPDDTPWNQITPSRTIVYHDCFDGLKCPRLLLPLDWSHGEPNGPEIAVAVIRRPAKVDVTDSRYGGAVIVNPSGPAASGVHTLLQIGDRFQNIVEADTDPKFDLHATTSDDHYFDTISFDPREVNHTLPQLDCFSNTFSRLVWSLGADAEGFISNFNPAFDIKWSRYLSRSATYMKCIKAYGNESIAYYIDTRSVIDNIMAIAERHGQWWEAEARKILQEMQRFLPWLECQRIPANTEWRRQNEEVLFWGTSYGTILGSVPAVLLQRLLRRQHGSC